MSTFYLGRYNCIEPIGAGALGETFRAKIYGVAGFEKQFAVKRIHADLCADPAFIERFVGAASAAAALGHEKIAAVHEVGAQGARYYVAADLIQGLDLGQLVAGVKERGEAITSDVAIVLMLDVLEALAYAHGRKDLQPNGVFHLGMGPRSLLLSPEGDVKLSDVGLFGALAVPGWATDARAATLAWVAPEVADGAAADARADVFSAGALLHLTLSGSAPFAGQSAAELRQRQGAGPPPPPACEGRLQAAISCALAPEPATRFPSVEAFSEALRPLLSSRAGRARGDLAMLVRRLSAQAAAPAPKEPVLNDAPTKNTFAGVGTGDAVPVQKAMLPGPATEKGMESVGIEYAPTEAIPLIPVPPPPPIPPFPPTPPTPPPPPPVVEEKALSPLQPQTLLMDAPGPGFFKPPEGGRAQAEPLPAVLPVLPRTERVATLPDSPSPSSSRRAIVIAISAAVVGLIGAGLWIHFNAAELVPPTEKPIVATPTPRPSPLLAQRLTPSPSPPQTMKPSSPPLAVKPSPPPPSLGAASLEVSTTPPGALVFVDGEARGAAPLSLPLAAGAHRLVAVAEHFKIHKEEVHAQKLALTLEPAKTSGPSGLKVRCKSKGELRIFVDGADSGLSCPNEIRINVTPGEHTVGLYSPRSDKTVEVKATVKDDVDHSTRIYVSY